MVLFLGIILKLVIKKHENSQLKRIERIENKSELHCFTTIVVFGKIRDNF